MSGSSIPAQFPLVSRRGALATFGLAGLALAASSAPLRAFTIGKSGFSSSSGPSLADLPPEWVAHQSYLLPDYYRYLGLVKMTRITPAQVIIAHAKEHHGVWNGIPPKSMWQRIVLTLRVVDRVAAEMNLPVTEIISAYRAPAYNSLCPGAKSGSWHQANYAVDVTFPTNASTVTAVTRNLRDRGLFKGGVGSYPTFTHVDTRGVNINW
jgi:Peptidase M15